MKLLSTKEIKSIRDKIKKGTLECDFDEELKNRFQETAMSMTIGFHNRDIREIEDFLMICLDYYTYSINGDMLINDAEYEILMSNYQKVKGNRLIYADEIENSKWEFRKHTFPGMVGSLGKIYELVELAKYVKSWRVHGKTRKWRLSPKYDGISACIEVRNHRIVSALTRYNGYEGQDISELVRGASNASVYENSNDGFYKVEIVTTQSLFEELLLEKKYANRRSATSGIINTPKNKSYAKYLTMIPLVYSDGKMISYIAPDSVKVETNNAASLYEEIMELMTKIRHADYPIRTDGVVITPLGDDVIFNPDDVMDTSIAFKVNMQEAYTTVDYGYVSIGNAGYAVPMLHVKPVEVNETIVEDVSLDTFDKYATMGLHEKETVMIFSAGNVIPKAKLPLMRNYPDGAKFLDIPKVCPYCNTKLTRKGALYKCENQKCSRVKSGKIANFVIKLGAENIAATTISNLYEEGLLTDIPSLFELRREDIEKLEGYGETSANNIISEIERLRTEPISFSKFLGALGIEKISMKKCLSIMKCVSIKDILNKKKSKLLYEVVKADNVALKTAEVFTDFIIENREMIQTLYETMNIVEDDNNFKYKSNVVFTGFRNPALKKRFEDKGIEVSDSINRDTTLLIAASYNPYDSNQSGKIKNALKKGIHIINLSEVEDIFESIDTIV